MLNAAPALLVVMGPSFVAALVGRAALGALVPAIFFYLAITSAIDEPDNYDMPGFGLRLWTACAGLAILSLLLGVAVRRSRR